MIMDKIEKKAQRNQNAAFDEELLSGLLRNSPVVKNGYHTSSTRPNRDTFSRV